VEVPLSLAPTRNGPSMSDTISRHDAAALALIDQALEAGFTPELIAKISESFELAQRDEHNAVDGYLNSSR
jgi:hypothetical protein